MSAGIGKFIVSQACKVDTFCVNTEKACNQQASKSFSGGMSAIGKDLFKGGMYSVARTALGIAQIIGGLASAIFSAIPALLCRHDASKKFCYNSVTHIPNGVFNISKAVFQLLPIPSLHQFINEHSTHFGYDYAKGGDSPRGVDDLEEDPENVSSPSSNPKSASAPSDDENKAVKPDDTVAIQSSGGENNSNPTVGGLEVANDESSDVAADNNEPASD